MTGLWVGLSVRKNWREIYHVLETWFPTLVITAVDWDSIEMEALKTLCAQNSDVIFFISQNESEFPTVIHFDLFPNPQDEAVIMPTMIELARRFSVVLDCDSICDGSGYGDSDAPFWSIVWRGGQAFLADNCNTAFADGADHPVKIVHALNLPAYQLDHAGRLTLPAETSKI
ncbi:MAG: hypothetical protein VXW65_11065 [Pseudomonadota bacterium]|nr:hypothetical protein [Pseudomonadota bacterium]